MHVSDMRSKIIILVIGCGLVTMGLMAQVSLRSSSNAMYVDDAYYWPVVDTIVPAEPVYDKDAREFIFLEDTMQYPDTIKMRIIERTRK